MQPNFTAFNEPATTVRTKEHRGLTLVWSEPDQRFMLPQPDGARAKTLFDDATETFYQVTINDPDFVYRDRTATAPDGTTMRERLYIFKDGNRVELPDPDAQRALLRARLNEFKLQLVAASQMAVPVVMIGAVVCLISFFWTLAGSAGIIAESFATGSVAAMQEVGYLLAWAVGGLFALAVLYYGVPALFRMRRTTATDYDDPVTPTRPANEQTSTTNIVVNHITGSGNNAQDYINRRDVR